MLKLICCIDKNNHNDSLWLNNPELIQLRNLLINNVVVTELTSLNDLNNCNVITLDNNINEILEIAKSKNVFVVGDTITIKTFERYYDELIIVKFSKEFNNNNDSLFPLNLNYFSLKESMSFNHYSINYYNSYKNKILFANDIVDKIKSECSVLKNELIAKYKKTPNLAIIQVGNDYSSNIYINNKIKLLDELGIEHTYIKFDQYVTEQQVIKQIIKFNKDKKINGILVQLPLPTMFNEKRILELIDPKKDVDCFSPINIANLYTNINSKELVLPCTASGIIKIFNYYNIELKSKNVVIIGRSNYISKPLIPLLLAYDCTVTICHSKTNNLKQITSNADIVICAIGKSNYFDKSYFNNNCVVIDVGINRDKDNKITGDVNFSDIIKNVKYITPVPNGVGLTTSISLVRNLLICYQKQMKK